MTIDPTTAYTGRTLTYEKLMKMIDGLPKTPEIFHPFM